MNLSFNTGASTFWRWTIWLAIAAVISLGCWYLHAHSKPSLPFYEWLETSSRNDVWLFLLGVISAGVWLGRAASGGGKAT